MNKQSRRDDVYYVYLPPQPTNDESYITLCKCSSMVCATAKMRIFELSIDISNLDYSTIKWFLQWNERDWENIVWMWTIFDSWASRKYGMENGVGVKNSIKNQ